MWHCYWVILSKENNVGGGEKNEQIRIGLTGTGAATTLEEKAVPV